MKHSISELTTASIISILLTAGPTGESQASQCTQTDQDVRPLHRSPPAYPHAALLMCIEGEVLLELTVGTDGRVDNVAVVESQPPGIFDPAAMRATRMWHFRPACVDGQARNESLKTRVEFRLDDESRRNCPDEPPQLDENMMALLGEVGALYTVTAESQLGELSSKRLEEILTGAEKPALDEDALRVWRYHRDHLLGMIDIVQGSQHALNDKELGSLPYLDKALRWDADPSQTRASLDDLRLILDDHARQITSHRRGLAAGFRDLARTTRFDSDQLDLLVLSFTGSLDEELQIDHLQFLEEQYQLFSDIVELLARERGRWRVVVSTPEFDDPVAAEEFSQLMSELYAIRAQDLQDWHAVVRGFEDYGDSD